MFFRNISKDILCIDTQFYKLGIILLIQKFEIENTVNRKFIEIKIVMTLYEFD